MKQPFIGKVKDEDRAQVERVIDSNPIVYELFDRKWVEANILTLADLYSMHPLFLRLLSDSTFPAKLRALKEKHQRYCSFVNTLKNDKENFGSHVSNLDLFFELGRSNNLVELEPLIPSSSKHSDIKVIINDIEYWGEVLTINIPQDEYEFRKLLNKIRIEYNQENETENCIYIKLKERYRNICEHDFLKFLLDTAGSLKLIEGEIRKIQYVQNGELLAEIEYFRKGNRISKGYYGGVMLPFEWINSSIRIKNIILDKIDKFQFPSEGNKRRFLYIYVKDIHIEGIDLDDAISGQENVTFFGNGFYREGRNENGVIHDEQRGPIFSQIDFVIYFFPAENRKLYRFNEEKNVDRQIVKDNF